MPGQINEQMNLKCDFHREMKLNKDTFMKLFFFQPDFFTVLSGDKNASTLATEGKTRSSYYFFLVGWVDLGAEFMWAGQGFEEGWRDTGKRKGKEKEKKTHSSTIFSLSKFSRLLTSDFKSLQVRKQPRKHCLLMISFFCKAGIDFYSG